MSPSCFNLDNVLCLVGISRDQLSGSFRVPCPECSNTLDICHDLNVAYCPVCSSVYDPLLLYDKLSDTNNLSASIEKIIQQDGLTGKANDKKTKAYIEAFPDFFSRLNRAQRESHILVSTGKWVRTHGDLLRSLDVYPGVTDSAATVLAKSCILWGEFATPKKDLKVSSVVTGESFTRKKAIIVPTWSINGPSGLWFISDDKKALYASSNKDVGSPGIAFYKDTLEYDTVLAVDDVAEALYLQRLSCSMYGRPAPVVAYSSSTSENDWALLKSKKRVVLSYHCKVSNGDYVVSRVCSRAIASAAVTLPACELRVRVEDGRFTLPGVYAEMSTGLAFVDQLLSLTPSSREAAYRRVREIITSLNGGEEFFRRVEREYGPDVCTELGFPVTGVGSNVKDYAGKKVESTDDGYIVQSPSSREKITNFSITLDRLLRYKHADKMEYDCTVHIGGEELSICIDHQIFMKRPALLSETLSRILVDKGSTVAPFINSKWASSLHDIVLLFSQPEVTVVVETAGFDSDLGTFVFPGVSIKRNGDMSFSEPAVGALPLTYRGPPDLSTWSSLPDSGKSVLAGLCAVVVHNLLYTAGMTEDTPGVFICPQSALGDNTLISRLLRGGSLPGIKLSHGRRSFSKILPSNDDQWVIAQLPEEYGMLLALTGEGTYSPRIPSSMLVGSLNRAVVLFDNMCIDFLAYLLADVVGERVDFNVVGTMFDDYIGKHFGQGVEWRADHKWLEDSLIDRLGGVEKVVAAGARYNIGLTGFNFTPRTEPSEKKEKQG